MRSGVFLALLTLSGCKTFVPLPASSVAALAASPGGYLKGVPTGLGPPVIFNDADFVYDAKFSDDSRRVALSRLGMKTFDVLVWAPPQQLCSAPVNGHAFDVESVAFSPDGLWVAAVSRDGSVRIFDADTGVLAGSWRSEEPLVTVAFHPSGRHLAVGGEQGMITVLQIDVQSPSVTLGFVAALKVHQDQVRGLAFAADGRLFSASWDKTVAVLRLEDRLVELKRFPFPAYPNDLSIDRAGKILGLGFSEAKGERNPEVYQREKRHELEPEREWDVGARVDADTGAVLQKYRGHHGVVATAAVSPDGSTLATGGFDKKVLLHVGATALQEDFGAAVRRVRFSPDGRWLAVAAWTPQNPLGDHRSDPSALVWELAYVEPEVVAR